VKPQTGAHLDKAQELLDRAATMLGVRLDEDAGRAAFHAAQAFLFENSGKAIKTHNGVQTEFARPTKDDPRFDMELRAFLGRAYNLEAIADYETGAGSDVSPESAKAAIQTARRLVEHVTDALK
jgi:uncharacterized protein (UPF0332 family)